MRVAEEDQTSYGFNGKGYFKDMSRPWKPEKFYSVVLSFKSLDENALLFLAYNKHKVFLTILSN